MKQVKIQEALQGLERINDEIRYKSWVEEEEYTVGFIAFSPQADTDSKQINHHDKDLVCQVIQGRGQLRLRDRVVHLEPGILCHVPKGTPHDFSAARDGEMILLYSLIATGEKK